MLTPEIHNSNVRQELVCLQKNENELTAILTFSQYHTYKLIKNRQRSRNLFKAVNPIQLSMKIII